jgi:hypothetical protein
MLLLRVPEQNDEQPVVCPGCASRFLIEVEGAGWRSRLLGELSEGSYTEGMPLGHASGQPLHSDVPGDELAEEEEETPDLVPMHGRAIFVDMDRTRTRLIHIAFGSVFVPSLLVFVLDALKGGMFVDAIFVALMALLLGGVAAMIMALFVAPSEKDRRAAAGVMEEKQEELRRQRRRQTGSIEAQTPPDLEGPHDGIADPRRHDP